MYFESLHTHGKYTVSLFTDRAFFLSGQTFAICSSLGFWKYFSDSHWYKYKHLYFYSNNYKKWHFLKYIYPQAIQDVVEFLSSPEQIWIFF